jgi:hypothetical protein
MKHLFTLFAVFITLNTCAEDFYKAKILLVSGQVSEGYASLPSNSSVVLSVKFKSDEKGKIIKIKNDEIENMIVYTANGNQYFFERTAHRELGKLFGSVQDKTRKDKNWVLTVYTSPYITFYYLTDAYYFDKKGAMVAKAGTSFGNFSELLYLLKRPGEDVPTVISSIATYRVKGWTEESAFRKTAMLYFDGETAFNERIENKEFKYHETQALAKAYTAYKEGQAVKKE